MPSDSRSVSFTFHREALRVKNSPEIVRGSRNLKQRLHDRFDKEKTEEKVAKGKSSEEKDCMEKGWSTLTLGNVSADSRRALRSGAEKLSKTISSVRTTFGTISQKFRSSTRRHRRLDEHQSPESGSSTMHTPQTRSRHLLGRTPTKLYSPFSIESPRRAWDKENDTTPTRDGAERERRRPFRFSKIGGFSVPR